MSHPWTDRLSDYVDEDLDTREREALEAHIETCDDCRETVAELRQVMVRAASLESQSPARDLWAGISERIGAEPELETESPTIIPIESKKPAWRMPEFTFSAPQLVAAGMLIAALSSAGVWFAMRSAAPEGPAGAGDPVAAAVPSGVDAMPVSGYERTIAELEGTLQESRGRLDPTTVEVLEQNLAIIDAAIAESRDALAGDPASSYLYRHLNRQMQQKVDLLEQAAQYAYASN